MREVSSFGSSSVEHGTEEGIGAEVNPKAAAYLKRLTLMDDALAWHVFSGNKETVELVLSIILGRKITVRYVATQKSLVGDNLNDRGVCFDAYAKDEGGDVYDVEVQRRNDGADPRRARYYSSRVDSGLLKQGDSFDKLTASYVIFVTENDVIARGKALYHFERWCKEIDSPLGDGSHIIYVNGAYEGDFGDPLANLIHDFRCKNPEDMFYPELAHRVNYFKNEKERGYKIMCSALAELREEGIREGEERGKIEGKREGIKGAFYLLLKHYNREDALAEVCHQFAITKEELEDILREE